SGCGKSTLLRSIAGLTPLDDGEIAVGGTVVDDGRRAVPPERRPVGLVFQEHALFPHLTIGANVGFGIRGSARAERATQVDDLLEMVGIAHLRDRYPHEVSGGERQRASVARAVAPRPALLLLDEPFASLDPNLRTAVRRALVGLLRDTGTPAVFVSHDQAEALALGDRLAVMRGGRLEQVGSGPDVYDRPANRFVAGFMGEASFLPVEPADGSWRTELGPVEAAADGPAPTAGLLAVIRPADVDLEPAADGPAEVVEATYEGPTWHYLVRLPSGATVGATEARSLRLAVGDRVAVRPLTTTPALVADAD
ncbi:MAG: ABC transporter ATP-binding protein, partial [Acidimicrobiales bacterium]|nr:ABC transporter ATP-binding protein [Acidimicrobiales bacterium]